MNLAHLITDFLQAVTAKEIDIYNEFSLQHELGHYLRKHISNSKVQFERNVSHFNFRLAKSSFEKKEIDIAITSIKPEELLCAIELKFPRNGQVPESIFSFCKDIAFLEQLVSSGFQSAYFLAIADDPLFYSASRSCEGIYGLFRGGKPITGIISKPTGTKDQQVKICGAYKADWLPLSDNAKYCLIQVGS